MGTLKSVNAQWDRLKTRLAPTHGGMPELTHAYVSGPMRNRPYFNRENFARVTNTLRAEGFVAFNPFEKDQETYGADYAEDNPTGTEDKTFDLRGALKIDCDWICDHANFLVMLDGWEESLGATAERALALALHLPILSEHDFDEAAFVNAILRPSPSDRVVDGVVTYDVESPLFASIENHSPFKPLTPYQRDLHRADTGVGIYAPYPPLDGRDEIRVVDPVTGGEKGSKPAQLGALDPHALMDVATVAGFGARKYARFNYAKGYAWSLSYDAMQRHLHSWWGREDNDPESGLSHLAHAAWHCLALLTFQRFGRGTDDRFPLE